MEISRASNRLATLRRHLCPENEQEQPQLTTCMTAAQASVAAKKESLSVIDNRTGKSYELPIKDDAIMGKDLEKIKSASGEVLRYYDPGYTNTVNCISKISFIDGDKGILRYRGYSIEELAEKSTFIEVAFLLLYGELPTSAELRDWNSRVMKHTYLHSNVIEMMKSFRYDAHPMGMLVSTVAAMSTFHPEANPALAGSSVYNDKRHRNKQIQRLLGTMPTVSACCYRQRIGRPFNDPNSDLSYCENFLYMMDRLAETDYRPHPALVRALDVLFILHAEHELNCSTSAVRHLASSEVDVYTSIAGAAAALYGPRHGGANEAVLRMLEAIGTKENIPKFIEDVKNKKRKLMGFGHRVYKNYDPRAKIVRKVADDVFAIVGREPLIEVAMELERIALSDEYFIKRKLYPNVDFYTGVIYRAIGFPTDMFPVLFTIPRTAGWLAHWNEFLDDPDNKIVRPRQIYKGHNLRPYVPVAQRTSTHGNDVHSMQSAVSRRREANLKK
eukprot:GILI01000789.1.p1 GENE.GILI01000789.1~~GILI01000789.1.p1  ORF type:complete len:500 (-),score=163.57 GILI01000789.1:280-1779(-)